MLGGFAGDAVIAILATMILGAGLDRTGVLAFAASFILRLSKGDERRLLFVLCGLTGLMSAFMQNPALTALFLPVVSRISGHAWTPRGDAIVVASDDPGYRALLLLDPATRVSTSRSSRCAAWNTTPPKRGVGARRTATKWWADELPRK